MAAEPSLSNPHAIVTRKLQWSRPSVASAVDEETSSVLHVRHIDDPDCPLKPQYLNSETLRSAGLATRSALAGRGNTTFFEVGDACLVLRHYYRGGLVRRLSRQLYVYSGLSNTRAFKEFDLLFQLHNLSLPVPKPYACSVQRRGLFYSASLITYCLPGDTLASRLQCMGNTRDSLLFDDQWWQLLGRVLARFHIAGVYHADLNAHNILVNQTDDANQPIHIIDFDRGRIRPLPSNLTKKGWCSDNVNRLERSCNKLVREAGKTDKDSSLIRERLKLCRSSWADSLVSAGTSLEGQG